MICELPDRLTSHGGLFFWRLMMEDVFEIAFWLVVWIFESEFWMQMAWIIMLFVLVHLYENREDGQLKPWKRKVLYCLLILGVLGTASIARHNAKMNQIAECKIECQKRGWA